MFNTLTLLAKSSETICFGPLCNTLKAGASNPEITNLFGSTLAKGINMMFVLSGLFLLLFLMWGGFDWITSEGDKEKLAKAQAKIRDAIVGMFIVVMSVTIFGAVTGDFLGIIKKTPTEGWIITLPSLGGP